MSTKCFCGASFTSTKLLHDHATDEGHLLKCGCGCLFKSEKGVAMHQKSSGSCGATTFEKLDDVVPVSKTGNKVALKCSLCPNKSSFKDAASLEQHTNSKHGACPTCKRIFQDLRGLVIHQKATEHCYCREHNEFFKNEDVVKSHMRASVHVTGFQCIDCHREFAGQQGLDDHLQACPAKSKEVVLDQTERSKAASIAVEEANLRCEDHGRTFKNIAALRQHKESVQHKPIAQFSCSVNPEKCAQTFTSYSAWFLHIESGKCKSGFDRSKLYRLLHAIDTKRQITYAENATEVASTFSAKSRSLKSTPKSIITEMEGEMDNLSISSSTQGCILTPEDSELDSSTTSVCGGVILTPSASSVTSERSSTSGVATPSASTSRSRVSSFGGFGLERNNLGSALKEWSFLTDSTKVIASTASIDDSSAETITYDNINKVWPCNICPRTFRKEGDLRQHLNSVAHAPKLFHCPPKMTMEKGKGKSVKAFKTISGCTQHVEAGACDTPISLLEGLVGICQKQSRPVAGQGKKLIQGTS